MIKHNQWLILFFLVNALSFSACGVSLQPRYPNSVNLYKKGQFERVSETIRSVLAEHDFNVVRDDSIGCVVRVTADKGDDRLEISAWPSTVKHYEAMNIDVIQYRKAEGQDNYYVWADVNKEATAIGHEIHKRLLKRVN